MGEHEPTTTTQEQGGQPLDPELQRQLLEFTESLETVSPQDIAPDENEHGRKIEDELEQYEQGLLQADILRGLIIARKLGLAGKKELQTHLLIGEDEAVEATLATQLGGTNLHYVAMFGGAKTKVLMYAHRIIGGIDRVATAPARADLKGGEFIGVSQPLLISETDSDGRTTERTIRNTAMGLVNSRSQVLNLNELPRIGQFATNAGFEIMESRRVETPEGYVDFPELEYIVATSNPFTKGNRRNQFSYNPGSLSRFQQAVLMGDEKYWDAITEAISMDDFVPTPDEMQQVVQLPELHLSRAAVKQGIRWDSEQRKRLKKLSLVGAKYIIQELDGEELPGRINVHLKHVTTDTSAIRGEQTVQNATLDEVFRRKMASTLIGLRPKNVEEIDGHIERMLDAAA